MAITIACSVVWRRECDYVFANVSAIAIANVSANARINY